jgi:hypothetical protein
MRAPCWAVPTGRLLALTSMIGGLLAIGPAVAGAHSCQGHPQPPPVHNANLSGVTVLSGCDAWAVGARNAASGHLRTLIVHWNGTSWKKVPSPNPASDDELRSVAAVSRNDIWAVGFQYVGGLPQTLIVHWNGTSWKTVASPDPGNPPDAMLFGVAAGPHGTAWAVGDYYLGVVARSLILHWNGTSWTQVPSPNPVIRSRYLELTSVAVVAGARDNAATRAWAVGWYADGSVVRSLIMRLHGPAWKLTASPSAGSPATYTQLEGVTAVSVSRAWAVGYFGNAPEGVVGQTETARRAYRPASSPLFDRLLILRWNGTSWKRATVANPSRHAGNSWLYGVTAGSKSAAWAVGSYFAGATQRTLVEHWNGTRWRHIASTNPGGSAGNDVLAGVGGRSCSQLWAVGYSFTPPNPPIATRC